MNYSLVIPESDLIPGVGTFIACLVLQLEIGILCGIGINILFILYHAARPKISVEKLKVCETIDLLNELLISLKNKTSYLRTFSLIQYF